MTFDPEFFSPRNRSGVDQHSTRLGATFRPTASSTWVASAMRAYGTFDDRFFADGVFDARAIFDDVADAYELQYQSKFNKANVIAGVGQSRRPFEDEPVA